MAYKSALFIAHCIYTAPRYVWDAPNNVWKNEYNGLPDVREDIACRVGLIEAAIGRAAKEIGTLATDPTVLKLFIVPECFFQGKEGAYRMSPLDPNDVKKTSAVDLAVEKLQTLVSGKSWEDWVFVFGTINAAFEAGPQTEMVNFALVQRGGYLEPTKAHEYCVVKRKAVFSLDLVRAADLQGGGFTDPEVAFGTTANEALVAALLHRILGFDIPETEKAKRAQRDEEMGKISDATFAKAGGWPALKLLLEKKLKEEGDTSVVRAIRKVRLLRDLPEVVKALVSEIGPGKAGANKLQVRNNPEIFLRAVGILAKLELKDVQDALGTAKFPTERWEETRAFLAEVEKDEKLRDTVFTKLALQEQAGEFGKLAGGDWLSATKRLLTQYVAHHKVVNLYARGPDIQIGDMPLLLGEQSTSNFALEDYTFTLQGVEKGDGKNVLFGLEICADHGKRTLGNIVDVLKEQKKKNDSLPAPPEPDIHIVPSAGMILTQKHIVAKTGGYAINCDGWNVPGTETGTSKYSTPMFQQRTEKLAKYTGTVKEVEFPNPTAPEDKTKAKLWTPHTELRKVGGTDVLKPKTADLDDALAKGIFSGGAGTLHIYSLVDL